MGVKDVTWLERKLDNLVVGGLKMHVNMPKHGSERLIQGEVIRGGRQRMIQREANWNDKHRMERTSDKLFNDVKR